MTTNWPHRDLALITFATISLCVWVGGGRVDMFPLQLGYNVTCITLRLKEEHYIILRVCTHSMEI